MCFSRLREKKRRKKEKVVEAKLPNELPLCAPSFGRRRRDLFNAAMDGQLPPPNIAARAA